MTFKQIEKQLHEIERIFDTNLQLHNPIAYESLKSFLKQSFIKYLQGEVEAVKHLAFGLSPDQRGRKWVDLEDLVKHYQAQIKEIEA